jgi:hypothetical protein
MQVIADKIAKNIILLVTGLSALAATTQLLHLPYCPILLSLAIFSGIAYWNYQQAVGIKTQRCIQALYLVGILAVVLWSAMWLAGLTVDFSHDGQHYHLPTMVAIAQGWNPVWDAPIVNDPGELWINVFPKGAAQVGAIFYTLTQQLNSAKAVIMLLVLGAFLLTYTTLLSIKISKRIAVVLSAAVALNPVVIAQFFTDYVDGILGVSLLILFCLLTQAHIAKKSLNQLSIWLIAAFVMNLKFTGILYVFLLFLGYLLIQVRYKRYVFLKHEILICALISIFASGVVGANPYITNTIRYHAPLYTVVGHNAKEFDNLAMFADARLHDRNNFHNLFWSTYSVSTNISYRGPNEPSGLALKIPLTVQGKELVALTASDTRIGGFGPWFGAIMAWSIVVLSLLIAVPYLRNGWILFIAGGLLLSVLINPGLWWARYVPQLWYVPLVLLIPLMVAPRYWTRAVATVALILIFGNAILVLVPNWYVQSKRQVAYAQEIRLLSKISQTQPLTVDFGTVPINKIKFKNNHIQFHEYTQLTCHTKKLIGSNGQFCIDKLKPEWLVQIEKLSRYDDPIYVLRDQLHEQGARLLENNIYSLLVVYFLKDRFYKIARIAYLDLLIK